MNSDVRPSFWKRLFLAFVRLLIVSLILVVLVWGGFLAVKEVQRSFDSVTTRMEFNRGEIEALRDDVDALSAEAPGQRQAVVALQSEAAGVEGRLDGLRSEIMADLAEQQQQLTTLEESVATVAIDSEAAGQTATEDAAALGAAIVALQGDLNETNGHIDALGGDIDALRADNETLNSDMVSLNGAVDSATEAATEIGQMQQTLALFHVWQLVTRARLRLAEDNVGAATADVEQAFRAVDVMLASESVPDEDALQVMLTRLALAFTNLPDSANVATRDLESAWDALDDLLTARLLPELASLSDETPILPVVEEATPEPTLEPLPPEPLPEPTPTPSS